MGRNFFTVLITVGFAVCCVSCYDKEDAAAKPESESTSYEIVNNDSGTAYGPFEFTDGAKITMGKHSFTVAMIEEERSNGDSGFEGDGAPLQATGTGASLIGTWECDVEETMKALGLSGTDQDATSQAMVRRQFSQLQYVIMEDTITARGLLQEGEHELRYEVKSAQGDVVIITLLDQNEDTTILVHSRDYIQFEVPPISFRRQGTSGAE